MSDYVILTDSSNDMTADLRERFGVEEYFPGYIIFPDGHQELAVLDWDDMSPSDFYGGMNKKNLYKTAVRGIGEQEEFFEKYLSKGLDILNITLSSSLSGTNSVCAAAVKNLQKKYPERKIYNIDTLRYSGATGLLISYAGEMKQNGAPIEEVADWLEKNKNRVHQIGTVDDLFFLRNMGRVSNISAFMGSMISIKPIADFNEKGMNQIIGKVKGYKKFYQASLEYMKRTIEDPENSRIWISCTNRKVQADQFKEMIGEMIKPKEMIQTITNRANGAAIGPGMVVAFYLGKPVSEGLKEEEKLLSEIINSL